MFGEELQAAEAALHFPSRREAARLRQDELQILSPIPGRLRTPQPSKGLGLSLTAEELELFKDVTPKAKQLLTALDEQVAVSPIWQPKTKLKIVSSHGKRIKSKPVQVMEPVMEAFEPKERMAPRLLFHTPRSMAAVKETERMSPRNLLGSPRKDDYGPDDEPPMATKQGLQFTPPDKVIYDTPLKRTPSSSDEHYDEFSVPPQGKGLPMTSPRRAPLDYDESERIPGPSSQRMAHSPPGAPRKSPARPAPEIDERYMTPGPSSQRMAHSPPAARRPELDDRYMTPDTGSQRMAHTPPRTPRKSSVRPEIDESEMIPGPSSQKMAYSPLRKSTARSEIDERYMTPGPSTKQMAYSPPGATPRRSPDYSDDLNLIPEPSKPKMTMSPPQTYSRKPATPEKRQVPVSPQRQAPQGSSRYSPIRALDSSVFRTDVIDITATPERPKFAETSVQTSPEQVADELLFTHGPTSWTTDQIEETLKRVERVVKGKFFLLRLLRLLFDVFLQV